MTQCRIAFGLVFAQNGSSVEHPFVICHSGFGPSAVAEWYDK